MNLPEPRHLWSPPFLAAMGVGLLGLTLASCSSSPSSPAGSTSHNAGGTAVNSTANTKYGTILVTSTGMTLYMNTGDTPTSTVCTTASGCTPIWPPLTTTGTPSAGSGVNAGMLGSFTRPGGSLQVTYDGHPLYTFVKDTAAGQVTGEGITHFGGTWYVVGTSGAPVTDTLSTPGSGY